MFEFEIQSARVAPDNVPKSVLTSFTRDPAVDRSILAWGEHCTECAAPQCYKTCDLYEPRSDLKCRRFVNGIIKVDAPHSPYGYIVRITFKTFAALWTPGTARVYTNSNVYASLWNSVALAVKRIDGRLRIGPWNAQRVFTRIYRAAVCFGRWLSLGQEAEYFVVQVYNPQSAPITFTLRMKSKTTESSISFLKSIKVDPGCHDAVIHLDQIKNSIDVTKPFTISLIPAVVDEPVTAYFGLMEFIRHRPGTCHQVSSLAKKCLVWDLDNVLWDGILTEGNPSSLRLKDGVREVLQELDRRGILMSVASKNDYQMAMAVLRRLEVNQYFLYPQIRWQPKSLSIRAIQRELNIGTDSMAFIDDSRFEQAEVAEAFPEILTIDAINYEHLLYYPCFQGSKSSDSSQRRFYYTQEQARKDQLRGVFQHRYSDFLRSCEIVLTVSRPTPENLARIHELVQRTNQMNFAPRRYTRNELDVILQNEGLEKYVLSAADRFGEYGVIGFAVVDPRLAKMTDLMLSCRVQAKQIEHAFLGYVLAKYRQRGFARFSVAYIKNRHNVQSGRVFDDLGFTPSGRWNQQDAYEFDLGNGVPEEDLVTVREESSCINVSSRSA